MLKCTIIGLAALVLAGSVVAVPIHKWVDAKGEVHYSNVPPIGVKKIEMLEYQGVGDTSAITRKESDSKPKEDKPDPDIAKRLAEEKEAARQNCVRSREGVQMLESGVRISRYNAKGERETLDDKGREQELEKARKAVTDWCN